MLERRRQQIEAESFFVHTDVDNRERTRARNKKIKKTNFVERTTWKLICSGGEKMRNASDQQGENERQLRKKEIKKKI